MTSEPAAPNGGWGREKQRLRRREEACGLNCRAYDLVDPVVAGECLPTLVVGDEDKLHLPFRGGEDGFSLVGLFVCGSKPHVPRRDPDKGRDVVVAANCGRVLRCVLSDMEDQDH